MAPPNVKGEAMLGLREIGGAGPAVLLAALLVTATGAPAATVDTAVTTPCAMSGWSNDKDPAGLNVRAAPSATAPVVATLPPATKSKGAYDAEFDIIGSRNGWLLIQHARFVDYDGGGPDQILFEGPGWVSGAKVGFEINDADVRSAPKTNAPVTAQLLQTNDAGGSTGPDSAAVDRVFSCSGDFADVLLHMPEGKPIRGWVTRLCSNQVTTCV